MSIYAAENKDACPLGTVSSFGAGQPGTAAGIEFWFTYFGWWKGTVEKSTALGKLTAVRMLKTTPMAYYCPKEDRVGLSYNTVENPWAFTTDPPAASRHTYVGYWTRPCAVFSGTADDHAYLIEGNYKSDAATNILPRGWPKFSKLKSKAIVSDIVRGPVDVRVRHKTGVNVYYANGSAKYVALSDFQKAQGVGTPSVTFPIPIPGTPGPKWADTLFSDSPAPGQGLPSTTTDAVFASNTMYLNDNPIYPTAAGLWNWLDKAP